MPRRTQKGAEETSIIETGQGEKKLRYMQKFQEDLAKNPPNAFSPEYIEELFMYKRRTGRRRKYQTVEELEKLCIEYFQDKVAEVYDEETERMRYKWVERPTIGGLALHLGMSRANVVNYGNKDEFFDTIKIARDLCESYLENALFDNRNPAGLCFTLKNGYGWRDSFEIEAVVPKDPLGDIQNQKALEARIADLPED